MRGTKTLDELLFQVEQEQKTKWDVTANFARLGFADDGGRCLQVTHEQTPFRLTANGLPKVCEKLRIPHSFLRTLERDGNADLATEILTRYHTARKKEEEVVLRCRKDGEEDACRALVSTSYAYFDNVDAVKTIKASLPEFAGPAVNLISYGDLDNLRGSLLFPELACVRDDSEYHMGIYYANSEDGMSAFRISPFLYRSYCTNGLVYGRRSADAEALKVVHHGHINPIAVQLQTAEAIKKALWEGQNLLDILGYAEKAPVVNPRAIIASLAKGNHLQPNQGAAWMRGYDAEPSPTGAGIVHGLTRGAQEYQGETRVVMEELAGMLLAPSLKENLSQIESHWEAIERQGEAFARRSPRALTLYTEGRD